MSLTHLDRCETTPCVQVLLSMDRPYTFEAHIAEELGIVVRCISGEVLSELEKEEIFGAFEDRRRMQRWSEIPLCMKKCSVNTTGSGNDRQAMALCCITYDHIYQTCMTPIILHGLSSLQH